MRRATTVTARLPAVRRTPHKVLFVIPRKVPVDPKQSDLLEAIRMIERQVVASGAKFAVVDEGYPHESSLMGTRDGLLNMALAVLRSVAAADAGRGWEDGGRFAWDDAVKDAMHQIPSPGAVWLVGAYLFRDHAALLNELRRWAEPDVAASLAADPAFHEPPGPAAAG